MRPDEALASRLAGWPRPFFAVLDGAMFADIRAALRQADLPARSLFLEQRGTVVTAGPYLAAVPAERVEALLRIPGIEAGCVFWTGPASEPELFRHLRSINLACIPLEPGPAPDPFAPATENVLFRHWDPAVLSVTLPVLEPAQRARLFGPMQRMALFAPGAGAAPGEALEAAARPDWPGPARGILTFSPSQMQAIQVRMAARSHRTIAAYLRETAPDHTAKLDDKALLTAIAASESEARLWGIRTEAGFGRFAWLMLATGGSLAQMAEARAYVTEGGARPDHRLRTLMQAMAAQLETRAVHA